MNRVRNRNSLRTVTLPTQYPVTLEEAKLWLRVDGTDQDTLIQSSIIAATQMAEAYTRRAFITQTLRLTLDRVPSRYQDQYVDGVHEVAISELNPFPDKIELPRPPLVSVSNIKSYGRDNSATTFSSSNYFVDAEGGRVILNSGQTWPTNLRDFAALEINYIAGYGVPTAVPAAIKDAIKMHVTAMFESRMACGDIPAACLCMLDAFRIVDRLSFNG